VGWGAREPPNPSRGAFVRGRARGDSDGGERDSNATGLWISFRFAAALGASAPAGQTQAAVWCLKWPGQHNLFSRLLSKHFSFISGVMKTPGLQEHNREKS